MVAFDTAYRGLNRWFLKNQRVLPWRNDPSLYRVWISEIMLAQTQVVTVIPYFERFVSRFPTLESLAKASEADVLVHWAGLGYYSRARNLLKAARLAKEKGGLPTTLEAWLEMPGVGPYTAGAITSIALNQPNAILDGNVERVLSRVHRVKRESDTEYKNRLWSLSREAVAAAHRLRIEPKNFNQALMELGATVCKPKNPICGDCPLQKNCGAYAAGETDSFPPKRKRKAFVSIRERAIAFLSQNDQVLLEQAGPGGWRKGLWDFPISDSRVALEKGLKPWAKVETKHVVTHHKILRESWVYRLSDAEAKRVRLKDGQAWFKLGEIESRKIGVGSALKRSLKSALEALE